VTRQPRWPVWPSPADYALAYICAASRDERCKPFWRELGHVRCRFCDRDVAEVEAWVAGVGVAFYARLVS
jgi:hypothetical protein